jgi:hypothetical protein
MTLISSAPQPKVWPAIVDKLWLHRMYQASRVVSGFVTLAAVRRPLTGIALQGREPALLTLSLPVSFRVWRT